MGAVAFIRDYQTERFGQIPLHVAALKLSGAALRVLLVLAAHANKNHEAWPSLTTIGRFTGLNHRTVLRAVATLEEASLIERNVRLNPAGDHASNLYRTCFSGSVEKPIQNQLGEKPEPPIKNETIEKRTCSDAGRGESDTEAGFRSGSRGESDTQAGVKMSETCRGQTAPRTYKQEGTDQGSTPEVGMTSTRTQILQIQEGQDSCMNAESLYLLPRPRARKMAPRSFGALYDAFFGFESRKTVEGDSNLCHLDATDRPADKPLHITERENIAVSPTCAGYQRERITHPPQTLVDAFEFFWAVYPENDYEEKDNPTDKRAAWRAFKTTVIFHGADPDQIGLAAAVFAGERAGCDYTMKSRSWLLQGRYER